VVKIEVKKNKSLLYFIRVDYQWHGD